MSAKGVTTENVVSFLKKKMIKKDYGSVTLYLQEGKITKVTEDNIYNPSSFIASAEKPINHLIVNTYRKNSREVISETVDKNITDTNNVDVLVEKSIKNDVELDENKG